MEAENELLDRNSPSCANLPVSVVPIMVAIFSSTEHIRNFVKFNV